MDNLLLRRLIVVANGRQVYNEEFHKGMNIIRGNNGSGKSTIIELIYYVLGADHLDWKEEALKCDYVLAEIEISGSVVTLRREIKKESKQSIQISWGNIEEVKETSWGVYSMRRSEVKESFSQVMLRHLNIPDVEDDTNLTMHQLLRVLYIDQITQTNLLMRYEGFDSIIRREAVSKTLMGAYNTQLFRDEIELKERQNNYEMYKIEIDRLQYFLRENGSNLPIEELRKKINENLERIQKITLSLSEDMQNSLRSTSARKKKDDTAIDKIFKEMKDAKEELIKLNDKYNSINYDIIDSEDFIADLKQRDIDLANSIAMREYLPTLAVKYCPVCLNPVSPDSDDEKCPLCKQELSENTLVTNALRLKNELNFQIKESQSLLQKKKDETESLKSHIFNLKNKISYFQTQVDNYSIEVEPTVQKERDDSQFLKGQLSKEIEYLNREIAFQEKIQEDYRILDNLNQEIEQLKRLIESKREKLKRNYFDAINKIKEIAKQFIRNDIGRDLPVDESSLSKLEIDFEKTNSFAINNRNNFAASSMVYLKNSIMFAFFFASLELPSMNYPRFILCDNIEDKGMEPERSHKFQLNLFEMAQKYLDKDFQMIITTSMIEPSLDNTEICVGASYTQSEKSLNFGSAV
ncbi:MAG: ATP-binding protein [Termitinemataceae bacterium]|nr:MAG: ATP-binding protein [Termitinemataceae bacterium]